MKFILSMLLMLYCKNETSSKGSQNLVDESNKKIKNNTELNLNNLYFISAEGGLYLREKPSKRSKALALIPEGNVVYVKETTVVQEKIEGVSSHWYKTNWTEKDGYIFGGFTIPLSSNARDDYSIFLSEYKKICISVNGCYSVKIYYRADAGTSWIERSQFLIDEKDKKIILGITYAKTTGDIIFLRRVKKKFYIFYKVEHLRNEKDVIGSIIGKLDINEGSIWTYDPDIFDGKDFSHYNNFNHEIIEYKDEYYHILKNN